jgi:hypothetical protein
MMHCSKKAVKQDGFLQPYRFTGRIRQQVNPKHLAQRANSRAGSGLQIAGSGRAWTLYSWLGLFTGMVAYLVKLALGLGFYKNQQKIQARMLCPKPRPARFAQNPGPRRLGL